MRQHPHGPIRLLSSRIGILRKQFRGNFLSPAGIFDSFTYPLDVSYHLENHVFCITKKRDKRHQLEQESRAKLKLKLSDWIVNDLHPDYGLDLKVRMTDFPNTSEEDYRPVMPAGFFVQLKASKNFEGEGYVRQSIGTDFVETYWLSELPVVLVIYEKSTDEFYWRIIQDFYHEELKPNPDWLNQNSITVKIDRENKLTEGLKKFGTELLQSRFRINRRFSQKLDPDHVIDENLELDELWDSYEDYALKSSKAILEIGRRRVEEEKFEQANRLFEQFLSQLETSFFTPVLDARSIGSLFKLENLLFEGIQAIKSVQPSLVESVEGYLGRLVVLSV